MLHCRLTAALSLLGSIAVRKALREPAEYKDFPQRKRWRGMDLLVTARELNKVIGDFQYPSGY